MLNVITGKDQKAIPILLNGKPIVLSSGQEVYSDAIVWPDHDDLALSFKATSTGIPNISIYMEECHCEPKDNAQDDKSIKGAVIIEGMIDTNWHNCELKPLALKAFRFHILENSTTAPDTALDLILSCK